MSEIDLKEKPDGPPRFERKRSLRERLVSKTPNLFYEAPEEHDELETKIKDTIGKALTIIWAVLYAAAVIGVCLYYYFNNVLTQELDSPSYETIRKYQQEGIYPVCSCENTAVAKSSFSTVRYNTSKICDYIESLPNGCDSLQDAFLDLQLLTGSSDYFGTETGYVEWDEWADTTFSDMQAKVNDPSFNLLQYLRDRPGENLHGYTLDITPKAGLCHDLGACKKRGRVRVSSGSPSVLAGGLQQAFVVSNDRIIAFGNGYDDRLGDGEGRMRNFNDATIVRLPMGQKPVAVSAGPVSACSILRDSAQSTNTVFCWPALEMYYTVQADVRQSGTAGLTVTFPAGLQPQLVTVSAAHSSGYKSYACAVLSGAGAATDPNNEIHCWDYLGQAPTPTKVDYPTGYVRTSVIASGFPGTCAVIHKADNSDPALACFRFSLVRDTSQPTDLRRELSGSVQVFPLHGGKTVLSLAVGRDIGDIYTVVVYDDGSLYSIGTGSFVPLPAGFTTGYRVTSVASNFIQLAEVCATLEPQAGTAGSPAIWCYRYGLYPVHPDPMTLKVIRFPPGAKPSALTLGIEFGCAVVAPDYTTMCWGNIDHSRPGQQTTKVPLSRSDRPAFLLEPITATAEQQVAPKKPNPSSLVMSGRTACKLSDSALRCWGEGTYGALAQTTVDPTSSAVPVTYMLPANDFQAVHVSIGGWAYPTIVVATRRGNVYYSGLKDNLYGISNQPSYKTPQRVEVPGRVVQVAVGRYAGLFITDEGKLFAMGYYLNGATSATYGKVGQVVEVDLAALGPGPNRVPIAIEAGNLFTVMLCGPDGSVWASGVNSQDEIGANSFDAFFSSFGRVLLSGPAQSISAGDTHSCAVLLTGDVECWGRNLDGQRGDGVESGLLSPTRRTPSRALLPAGVKAAAVAAGSFFTCVLSTSNQIFCFGYLPGTTQRVYVPTLQEGVIPPGRTAVSIKAGEDAVCILLDNEDVHCWGTNPDGLLGIGEWGPTPAPVPKGRVLLRDEIIATSVSTAPFHACGVYTDRLACWGSVSNSGFELGRYLNPTWVTTLPAGRVIYTAVSSGYTCAIIEREVGVRSLWCATVVNNNVYEEIAVAQPIQVGFGLDHRCLINNGTTGVRGLHCWGSSTYSQIDDWGKQATYPKPYAVALLAGEEPVKVVCGFYTTYVLTASGKVLARGRGDSGEIGILPSDLELNQDFRRVASTFRVVPLVTPTMVVTSRVLDVAAGGQHACALVSQTTRRDVFCWGRNPKRELGQPTTTTSTHVPTRVNLPTYYDSASGRYIWPSGVMCGWSTCAVIMSTGEVYVWGSRSMMGMSISASPDPVKLTLPYSLQARMVSISMQNICILLTDGATYCLGNGDILGDLVSSDSLKRMAAPRDLTLPQLDSPDAMDPTDWFVNTAGLAAASYNETHEYTIRFDAKLRADSLRRKRERVRPLQAGETTVYKACVVQKEFCESAKPVSTKIFESITAGTYTTPRLNTIEQLRADLEQTLESSLAIAQSSFVNAFILQSLYSKFSLPPTLRELLDAVGDQIFFTLLEQARNETEALLANYYRPDKSGMGPFTEYLALQAPQKRTGYDDGGAAVLRSDRHDLPFFAREDADLTPEQRLRNVYKTLPADYHPGSTDPALVPYQDRLQSIWTTFCEGIQALSSIGLRSELAQTSKCGFGSSRQSPEAILSFLYDKQAQGQPAVEVKGMRTVARPGSDLTTFLRDYKSGDASLFSVVAGDEPLLVDPLQDATLDAVRVFLKHRNRAKLVYNARLLNDSFGGFKNPQDPSTWADVLPFGSTYGLSEPYLDGTSGNVAVDKLLRIARTADGTLELSPPDLDLGPRSPADSIVQAILDQQAIYGNKCDCLSDFTCTSQPVPVPYAPFNEHFTRATNLVSVDFKACDELRKEMQMMTGRDRAVLLRSNLTTDALVSAAIANAVAYFRDAMEGCESSLGNVIQAWLARFSSTSLATATVEELTRADTQTNLPQTAVYQPSSGPTGLWFLSPTSGRGIFETQGVTNTTSLGKVAPILYGVAPTGQADPTSVQQDVSTYASYLMDHFTHAGPVPATALDLPVQLRSNLRRYKDLQFMINSTSGGVGSNLAFNFGHMWKRTCKRANDPAFAPVYSAIVRFASAINQQGDSHSTVQQLLDTAWSFPSASLPFRAEPAVLSLFSKTYGIELPFTFNSTTETVLDRAAKALDILIRREGALQQTRFQDMKTAVANLFIEDSETRVDYELYFKQCKPSTCSVLTKQSPITTAAVVFGIGGGIKTAMDLVFIGLFMVLTWYLVRRKRMKQVFVEPRPSHLEDEKQQLIVQIHANATDGEPSAAALREEIAASVLAQVRADVEGEIAQLRNLVAELQRAQQAPMH